MTQPYTPSSAIDFIEHFEANKFTIDPTSPFYYEPANGSVPASINFGYGLNLTAAASNPTLQSDINAWFAQYNIFLTPAQWASFSTPSSILASSLNATQNQFYYDSASNAVYFGYGNNLTTAENNALNGNPALQNDIISLLATYGVILTNAQWTSLSTASLNANQMGAA